MKVRRVHARETPGLHEPPACLVSIQEPCALSGKEYNMKTGEVLKLITLGYKPVDLKELNELSKDKPDAIQIALSGSNLSDVKDYLSLISDEDGQELPDPEPEDSKPAESEQTPDYKSMYEELKKKFDAQEVQIKEIQNQNQRQDQSGSKQSDEDILIDIVSSFM